MDHNKNQNNHPDFSKLSIIDQIMDAPKKTKKFDLNSPEKTSGKRSGSKLPFTVKLKVSKPSSNLAIIGMTAVAVFLITGSAFAISHFQNLKSTQKPSLTSIKPIASTKTPGTPEQKTQEKKEAKSLVEKVGKLFLLPPGEIPRIGTVKDAGKLKNDPFFANAEDGDKVLIFQSTGKAFLYRESEDRLIEVGTVGGSVAGIQSQGASEASSSGTP